LRGEEADLFGRLHACGRRQRAKLRMLPRQRLRLLLERWLLQLPLKRLLLWLRRREDALRLLLLLLRLLLLGPPLLPPPSLQEQGTMSRL